MDHSKIPKDLQEFLEEFIESVSQLEILFYFLETPESEITAAAISKELRTHVSAVGRVINKMAQQELITKSETGEAFCYHTSNFRHEKIRALRALYQERPATVISFIYEKPSDKLKSFADAFKINKDK